MRGSLLFVAAPWRLSAREQVAANSFEDLYPLDVLQAWDSAAEFIALFARSFQGIWSNVAAVEQANRNKVVLYLATTHLGHLLAMLTHGVLNKGPLTWKESWGEDPDNAVPFSQEPLLLRVFADGDDYPSYHLNASVCVGYNPALAVREANLQRAQRFGNGSLSFQYVRRHHRYVYVVTYNRSRKIYRECNDLVYSKLDDMNRKWAKTLEDRALRARGIKNATQFTDFLDQEVGDWTDAPSQAPRAFRFPTVGVPDRLLAASLNVLSPPDPHRGQENFGPMYFGAWGQFVSAQAFEDISLDHVMALGRCPELGDREPVLSLLFESLNSSKETRAKVLSLQALLQCAAYYRFTHFRHGIIWDRCWQGGAEPFAADPKRSLDDIASFQTKEAARQLSVTEVPQDYVTWDGWSRTLIQILLDPEMANQLAYVSELLRPANTTSQTCSQLPGQPCELWRNVSFVDAYNILKNTEEGGDVTARVLLTRTPWVSGGRHPEYAAHSKAFSDRAYMLLAISVLNDMRWHLLAKDETPSKSPSESELWPAQLLALAAVCLMSALCALVWCRYKRTGRTQHVVHRRDEAQLELSVLPESWSFHGEDPCKAALDS